MPVSRSGDTESAGVGNRFAYKLDQRVVDARVLDARGSEKKFHHAFRNVIGQEYLQIGTPLPDALGVGTGEVAAQFVAIGFRSRSKASLGHWNIVVGRYP